MNTYKIDVQMAIPNVRCVLDETFTSKAAAELIACLLRQIANDIEARPDDEEYRRARDFYGNVVGTYHFTRTGRNIHTD